jgi:glycosyltransferase involved in cell wall biosynthesis
VAAVACIIPAYNHVRFVADAVLSAAGPHTEVIAVDDASTDGTFDALQSLVRPGVTVLRNETNRGIAYTVNRAVAASKAPYLTFLASDDRWLPSRLDLQLPALESGAQWSVGQAHVIDAVGARVTTEPQGGPPADDGMLRTLLRGQAIYAPTLMVRRDLLEQCGGFSDALWEDLALTLRLSALADPAYIPHPLVEYRVHGANLHLTLLDGGLHLDAHVAAVRNLAEWSPLPPDAARVVREHLAVWNALAALRRGELPPTGLSRSALSGVVVRQARDLVREVDGKTLRRLEILLRLRGLHEAARALGEARGGPLLRRAIHKGQTTLLSRNKNP